MIDLANLPFRVERMRVEDVDAIMAIEHEAFSEPWPASAYRHEIEKNDLAHYFVVRARDAAGNVSGWAPNATGLTLTVAANYGGRWDVLQAMNRLCAAAPEKMGNFSEKDLAPWLA